MTVAAIQSAAAFGEEEEEMKKMACANENQYLKKSSNEMWRIGNIEENEENQY